MPGFNGRHVGGCRRPPLTGTVSGAGATPAVPPATPPTCRKSPPTVQPAARTKAPLGTLSKFQQSQMSKTPGRFVPIYLWFLSRVSAWGRPVFRFCAAPTRTREVCQPVIGRRVCVCMCVRLCNTVRWGRLAGRRGSFVGSVAVGAGPSRCPTICQCAMCSLVNKCLWSGV